MKLSILIPTIEENNKYLLACIRSIQKNSINHHQICVHIDSVYCPNTEWLLDHEKIDYSHDRWQGMATAFNKCFELAENDWLFFANDDFYFGPAWDEILMFYLLSNKRRVVSVLPVQPTPSPPIYDCGRTIETFDQAKFNRYVLMQPKKEIVPTIRPSTFWCAMHRDVFEKIGKFDEQFNPKSCADIDLQYRLLQANVELITVPDIYIYHFQKKATEKLGELPNNADKFEKKWNKSVEEVQKLFGWVDP